MMKIGDLLKKLFSKFVSMSAWKIPHEGSIELWRGRLAWITLKGIFKVGEVRFILISIDSLYYSVVLNAAQLYLIM